MKVETKGHTTHIRDTEGNLTAFVMKLTHEFKTFEKHNLIVDVLAYTQLGAKELNALLPLSKTHRKAKKSFVVVADTDFDKVSGQLIAVPTVQEAHDVIEMEEIERDLGF